MTRQLPDSWCFAPLSDLVEINPGIDKAQFQDSAEVPFVPMPAVEAETGRIDVSGRRPFAEVKSGFTSFASGDVLFAKITPCMENGKMAVVPDLPSGVGFGSTEFFVLRPTAAVNAKLLYYFVSSAAFRQEAQHHMTGAVGQKRVPKRYLESVRFPVPPIKEQSRIVEKIETLFAELDKGEESLRQVQTLLARYRQSVLKAAVTGELTADWRARHAGKLEHGRDLLARILKARRENWQGRGKYKEPVEPDTSSLPELPEGWVWCSTGQLSNVQTGATPKRGESRYYDGGTIPWVTSTAVNNEVIVTPQDYITEDALRETNAKVFPSGTLIVAMYGEGQTRGRVSELGIPAATNQACAALLVEHLSDPVCRFLKIHYQFNYESIRMLSSGGVQPNLNLGLIKQTPVPLASEEELAEVVRRVAEEMGRVQEVGNLCEEGLRRSAALRQAILRDAFAGKLVPQDPNDEPASELLARIRAQRASESRKTTRRAATA